MAQNTVRQMGRVQGTGLCTASIWPQLNQKNSRNLEQGQQHVQTNTSRNIFDYSRIMVGYNRI